MAGSNLVLLLGAPSSFITCVGSNRYRCTEMLIAFQGTDDLGRGNSSDSLTTGNSGSRSACGVIGYA